MPDPGLREIVAAVHKRNFSERSAETDAEILRLIEQAVAGYRAAGDRLSAGLAAELGHGYMWMDPAATNTRLLNSALDDFAAVVDTAANPVEGVVARLRIALVLSRSRTSRSEIERLEREAAQVMLDAPVDPTLGEHLLVRGFDHCSDFNSFRVEPAHADFSWGSSFRYSISGSATWSYPSAFQIFAMRGDYEDAQRIVERYPSAFTTTRLRAWRSAVSGFVNPSEAAERFDEAGAVFATDVLPPPGTLRSWDASSTNLWAPYFRSRAFFARACAEPIRLREHLRAALLDHDALHFVNSSVVRYALLVRALNALLDNRSPEGLDQAREALAREREWQRLDGVDELADRFMALGAEVLRGFLEDPEAELVRGRISAALAVLNRIPLLGQGVGDQVGRGVGQSLLDLAFARPRTALHRTLEGISDEKHLHRVLLRLAQASLPTLAQVRHGPLEYGKDVVALLDVEGRRVLRMYQAKLGNLSRAGWREVQPQLEEMFFVPLTNYAIPSDLSIERVGILVFTGHVQPNVDPVVAGWLDEQRRRGRAYELMNIDALVRWIERERLVGVLRSALQELGLPLIVV